MLKLLGRSLACVPMLLGAVTWSAIAQEAPTQETPAGMEQILRYGENTGKERIGQVTSVSQLSDVKPTDWAFQALQSLVERYGCIAGYPDKTYRGNRAMTRYEFAAGLNACMDRVNELIAAGTADLAKKEDVDTLKRLQEEFANELAELRGKVDGLEARTEKLEKQQFSTTAKLNAEVILAAAGVLGDDRALNSDQQRVLDDPRLTATARENLVNRAFGSPPAARRDLQDNTIVGNRVRLNVDASFTGKDRLRTTLQARNITSFSGGVTGTAMTRLGFDGSNNNSFELRRLEYRFPLTPLTTVFVGGGSNDGLEFNDSVPTLSPVESSGSASVSRFGRFNPIFRASTGTGIIINQKLGREFSLGEKFTLSLGYLVPTGAASNPADKNGLFNGSYAALGQLVFQPTSKIGLGFTYVNAFYRDGAGVSGGTGSAFANDPFSGAATRVNAYGVQASIKVSPKFNISGWVGLTEANSKENTEQVAASGIIPANGATRPRTANENAVKRGDDATIWNWAVALSFPDLLKEGNLGALIFGMPPKVSQNDFGANVFTPATAAITAPQREDKDTSFHIEGLYRWRVNDNVAITPGFIVILNPEHNDNNDTIYVGTIRTTFTF